MHRKPKPASPARGVSNIQQVLAEETANYLSDRKKFRAQLHTRVGGPGGLANLVADLLDDPEVLSSIRAKLLMEVMSFLGKLEQEDAPKDLGLLPEDEIEAIVLSINQKERDAAGPGRPIPETLGSEGTGPSETGGTSPL